MKVPRDKEPRDFSLEDMRALSACAASLYPVTYERAFAELLRRHDTVLEMYDKAFAAMLRANVAVQKPLSPWARAHLAWAQQSSAYSPAVNKAIARFNTRMEETKRMETKLPDFFGAWLAQLNDEQTQAMYLLACEDTGTIIRDGIMAVVSARAQDQPE
jgi:hypothetical protein